MDSFVHDQSMLFAKSNRHPALASTRPATRRTLRGAAMKIAAT